MKKIIGIIGIVISLSILYQATKIFIYEATYGGNLTALRAISIGLFMMVASIIAIVSKRKFYVTLIALVVYIFGALVSIMHTYNYLYFYFCYFLAFIVLLIIEMIKNKEQYKCAETVNKISLHREKNANNNMKIIEKAKALSIKSNVPSNEKISDNDVLYVNPAKELTEEKVDSKFDKEKTTEVNKKFKKMFDKLLLIFSIAAIIILSMIIFKENKFEQKPDTPVNVAEKFFVYAMKRDFIKARMYFHDKYNNNDSMINWQGPTTSDLSKRQRIYITEIGPKYQSDNEAIVQINYKLKDSERKYIVIFELRKINSNWKIYDWAYRDWNARNMVFGDRLMDYSLYPFISEDDIDNTETIEDKTTDEILTGEIVTEEILAEEPTPKEIQDVSLYGYWENQDGVIISFDENNSFNHSQGYGCSYKVYENGVIELSGEGGLETWKYHLEGDTLYINANEIWTRKNVSDDFNIYDLENDNFDDSPKSNDITKEITSLLLGKWKSINDDGYLEFYTEMYFNVIGIKETSLYGIGETRIEYSIIDPTKMYIYHKGPSKYEFELEDKSLTIYYNDKQYVYKKELTYDYDKTIRMYGQWNSSDGSVVTLDPFYGVTFEGIDIDNNNFYFSGYNKISYYDGNTITWEYEISNYDSYETLIFYKNGDKETAKESDIIEYQRKLN